VTEFLGKLLGEDDGKEETVSESRSNTRCSDFGYSVCGLRAKDDEMLVPPLKRVSLNAFRYVVRGLGNLLLILGMLIIGIGLIGILAPGLLLNALANWIKKDQPEDQYNPESYKEVY